MRHYVVATQLLRQARAALDDEADPRPARQADPEPQTESRSSRLVTVARRARNLAASALTARAT